MLRVWRLRALRTILPRKREREGMGKGKGIYLIEAEIQDPWARWPWGKPGVNLGNPADKEDLTIGLIKKDDKGADKVHEGADK